MHKKVYIVQKGYGKEKKDFSFSVSQQPSPLFPNKASRKSNFIPVLMSLCGKIRRKKPKHNKTNKKNNTTQTK